MDDFWDALPPRRVRLHLEHCRASGQAFSDVWSFVLSNLRCPDRQSWIEAFMATQDAWGRAYELVPPTRAEEAASHWARDELVDLTFAERTCAHCDEPIPPDRDPNIRYCSIRCRREANYRLERERISQRRKHPEAPPPGALPMLPQAVEVTETATESRAA